MNAADLARAAIRALLMAGATEFVLAPGSRNTPLSLELAEAESRGLLRLHVRIDERTAAFLALGFAKGSGKPAVVVSTSGTAVANFMPAVVEASLSHVPIAVISANRPLSMLGTGANQTIKQVGLFGDFVRAAVHLDDQRREGWDAALRTAILAMSGSPAGVGPVQLDLGLTPPLVSDDLDFITPLQPNERIAVDAEAPSATLALPPRSLVVIAECDPGLARTAAASAQRAGFPVHVEAGSPMAHAADTLRAGTFLVRSSLVQRYRPEHLLIVGRPTLSRPIPALAGADDIEVTVVSDDPSVTNPMGLGIPALRASSLLVTGRVDAQFGAAWNRSADAAAKVIDSHNASVFDAGTAAAIVYDTRPELLIVASSNPIRDLDERAVRRSQRVIVNRGAAGIDGLVSTAIGAALADQVAGAKKNAPPAIALLGDLALLHDSTGLVIGPQEPRPDLSIVVINNDGGAIFASLEQGAPEYAEYFERVFGTPHGTDLERLCAATSTPYQRCGDRDELADALCNPPPGIRVIEVPVSRVDERERRADLTARVVAAIDAALSRDRD